jgi:hypothetical protein
VALLAGVLDNWTLPTSTSAPEASVIAPEFARSAPVVLATPSTLLIVIASSAPVPCQTRAEPALAKVTGVVRVKEPSSW